MPKASRPGRSRGSSRARVSSWARSGSKPRPRASTWPRASRAAGSLGGEPVETRYADVEAGTRSAGHRFLHPGFFELRGTASVDSYLGTLRDHGVMASGAERRDRIREELARLCRGLGGRLVEDDELV